MQKLIQLRGLPASGKTTWCKQFIYENPEYIRISRDDIRNMLTPDFEHGSKMEDLVSSIESESIYAALNQGYSVIIDSTGFRFNKDKYLYATDDLTIEIKDFTDVDVKTCIQRDQQRDNSVGKNVIIGMAKKYLNYKE